MARYEEYETIFPARESKLLSVSPGAVGTAARSEQPKDETQGGRCLYDGKAV